MSADIAFLLGMATVLSVLLIFALIALWLEKRR